MRKLHAMHQLKKYIWSNSCAVLKAPKLSPSHWLLHQNSLAKRVKMCPPFKLDPFQSTLKQERTQNQAEGKCPRHTNPVTNTTWKAERNAIARKRQSCLKRLLPVLLAIWFKRSREFNVFWTASEMFSDVTTLNTVAALRVGVIKLNTQISVLPNAHAAKFTDFFFLRISYHTKFS